MAPNRSIRAAEEGAPGEAFPQRPVLGVAKAEPYFARAFGFQRNPFPVVPDVPGFFFSRRTETIVVEVLHAIENRKGFMVITGEVGLGKTTLSRRILMELEDRGIQTALVFNTFHEGADLLREINKDFGLEKDVRPEDRSDGVQSPLTELNEFLLASLASGVNCAIIIDDAQQLSIESLELVRQVSNLETDSEKLVQILLVGQPELEAKLEAFELRQLESRIVLRHVVSPYTLEETRQYVQFKLTQAGGDGRLRVAPSAFRLLQRLSGGNPRQINILMDRCLYAAVAFSTGEIDRRLLRKAARDIRADKVPKPRLRSTRLAQAVVLLFTVALVGVLLLNPSFVAKMVSALGLSAPGSANADENALVGLETPTPVAVTAPELEQQPVGTGDNTPVQAVPAVSQEKVPVDVEPPTTVAATVPETARQPLDTSADMTSIAGTSSASPAEASVVEFLKAYELERYSPDFLDALTTGWTDEIAARIRLDTGLRLVTLLELPAGIEAYPVLKLDASDARDEEYLLFWRSEIWSHEHRYYHYRRAEVLALQRALRQLGLYRGDLDGLPGPLTSKALRSFQSAMNLRPSGIPDAPTLFLLENMSAAAAPVTGIARGSS